MTNSFKSWKTLCNQVQNWLFKNLRIKLWICLGVLFPIWFLIYVYGLKGVEFTTDWEFGYFSEIEFSRLSFDCLLSLIGAMFGTVITITFIDRLHTDEGTEQAKPLYENIIRNFNESRDNFISAVSDYIEEYNLHKERAEKDIISILNILIKKNPLINPNMGGGTKKNYDIFYKEFDKIIASSRDLPDDANGKAQLLSKANTVKDDFEKMLNKYTFKDKLQPEEKRKICAAFLNSYREFCSHFISVSDFIK